MRRREIERFKRLMFTDHELEIRSRLTKNNKHNSKYKIIITEEKDDDLSWYAAHPEKGAYIDTIYFNWYDEWNIISELYEGLFCQVFRLDTGECIDSGTFDPSWTIDIFREIEPKCEHVCKFCWYRINNGSLNFGCAKETKI